MTDAWMPHGTCFLWQWQILVPYCLANAVIAASYISLWLSLRVVRDYVTNSKLYGAVTVDMAHVRYALASFGMFIVWCGLTHIMDIRVVFAPEYVIETFILAVTGVFSSVTAFWLAKIAFQINHTKKLPTPLEGNS